MNRRYSLASLALAALGLLSACSKSDIYDGEYSKDGYYNESRVIYFPNSGQIPSSYRTSPSSRTTMGRSP